MRNIRLTIEYDGSNYLGWQRQKSGSTIQNTLEEAIRSLTTVSYTHLDVYKRQMLYR